jgi:hypothetical protein
MRTNSTLHLYADEAIENLGFHCDHSNGSRSYRMSPSMGACATVYLSADHPAELRNLAQSLIEMAEMWEEEK